MQVKSADSEKSAPPQPVLSDENQTIPPGDNQNIHCFRCHPVEWRSTDTVTPPNDSLKP